MTPLPAGVPPQGLITFVTADLGAPSFRLRLAVLIPLLQQHGWRCEVQQLKGLPGWRIWALRGALRASQAVVLHKLRLDPWEARWLRRLQPSSWFDVDDAIWLRQPKWVGHERAPSPRRARNFAAMCANAAITSVGNQMLADRALAAGGNVRIFPTAIDVLAHPERPVTQPQGQVLAWVGLPGNLKYLEPLRPVLARLAQEFPALRLRVISSAWPDWPELPLDPVVWSRSAEVHALCQSDIGIMPLSDDEYSRGKCAFKLLQYMAAGLPCVASAVGANTEVVLAGRTGLLADSPQAWESALRELLSRPAQRLQMGLAGRARALANYDTRVILPAMAEQLVQLASRDANTQARSASSH